MAETETKQPTAEDMQAIANAGANAAQDAETKAQAEQKSAEGMRAEAEKRGISLSKEDAELVASATIAQLEARGAFDPPPEPVTPPPSAPPAPTEPVAAEPAVAEAPAADATPTPPKRKSWADKYLGG